jgi:choline monooxygenase
MDAITTREPLNDFERMDYERDRKETPEGFPNFPDIPGRRYVDPDFLKLEKDRMWKRAWLYAGHTDQLPKPGSWFITRNTGSPVIVVRDLKGELRAFFNTCQHRGAPLVTEEAGEARGFVCGYHGWSYTLDGKLTAVRDRRDFVDLDFSCRSLVSLRCETLGNLIFINEDLEAQTLMEDIGPMGEELEQFQLDTLRLVDSRSYDVECNVKILLDAFLEVYHIKSIHGMIVTLWPNGHSRMVTPNRRPDWKDPGTLGMPKISTVGKLATDNNVSYHIYPNFVMPPSDSGIPLLQFWPMGDRKCRVVSSWVAPEYDAENPDPLWEKRLNNWERILYEDLQYAPQIQESLESKGFRAMPLNYQERRLYHWHEELDRRIGLNRVPEGLAVEQVLQDWVQS